MRKLLVPVLSLAFSSFAYGAEYPAGKVTREVTYQEGGGPHCEERFIDARDKEKLKVYINKFPYTDLSPTQEYLLNDGRCMSMSLHDDDSLDDVCKLRYDKPNGVYDKDGKQVIVPVLVDCKSLDNMKSEERQLQLAEFKEVLHDYVFNQRR